MLATILLLAFALWGLIDLARRVLVSALDSLRVARYPRTLAMQASELCGKLVSHWPTGRIGLAHHSFVNYHGLRRGWRVTVAVCFYGEPVGEEWPGMYHVRIEHLRVEHLRPAPHTEARAFHEAHKDPDA